MIIFVLAMAAVSLIISKALLRSFLAPLSVFAAVWGISLSMLWIETLLYYPMHGSTWVFILGAWMSFLVGTVLVALPRRAIPRKFRSQTELALPKGYPLIVTFLGVLSLLGSLRFVRIIVDQVGLIGWLLNPLGLRWALTQGGEIQTGLMTYVFQGVTMVAAAFGGVWAVRRPRFIPVYFPVLAAGLFDMFFLGRAHTIFVCIIFVSAAVLSRHKHKATDIRSSKKRLILLLGLLVMFAGLPFAYISSIRNSVGGARGWTALSNAVMPFVDYVSVNWYLVDDIMQDSEALTWGKNVFSAEAEALYRLNLLNDDPRLERLYSASREVAGGKWTNTYTLVGSAYADFGVVGALVLLCALGGLTTWVFIKYQSRRHLWNVVALCFIYVELILSIQGDQLGSPQFGVGVTLGFVLAFALDRLQSRARAGKVSSTSPLARGILRRKESRHVIIRPRLPFSRRSGL